MLYDSGDGDVVADVVDGMMMAIVVTLMGAAIVELSSSSSAHLSLYLSFPAAITLLSSRENFTQ